MMILQAVLLAMLLTVLPTVVGSIFIKVDKSAGSLPFMWISGQLLMWAGFQLLCVPLVLTGRSFAEQKLLFSVYCCVLLLAAFFLWCRRRKSKELYRYRLHAVTQKSRTELVLWIVFWALLLFQLVQAVRMTYGDGDDAFYVALSTITGDSGQMYQKIPYTGETTKLDVRHGLAPFPIWITYLSEISGVPAVSTAHIGIPLMLLPMTYGIYYLLGKKLFTKKREQLPFFLIVTELLVLFGDYSFYTVENFMIARSRQGKAALGSIIIPALLLILLLLLERVQEKKSCGAGYWVLFAATLISACLCSTLGALLVCMLAGVTGFFAAFCYRQWKFLLPMAVCCIPCVLYAVIYLMQKS